MTNDTNTLNGALQELGETMADNLTTMGVPSTYDEGLTTLAGKILDIGPTPPTPTPASLDLSLTAGKQILSYADVSSGTEYATFTATVLDQNDDPLPGVSVSIYKDNVLWYTAETGAGGTISKTYDSQGVGDVSFHAVCGSLVTVSYGIEDYDYYSTNTFNAQTSIDKAMLNTTNCTVEFDIVKSGDSGAYLDIGTDSNNYIGVGLLGSGLYGFLVQHSGNRVTTEYDSNLANGTYHVEFTYNNGSMTSVINNKTKTYTYTQPITKLLQTNCWSNGQITNIKVKKL